MRCGRLVPDNKPFNLLTLPQMIMLENFVRLEELKIYVHCWDVFKR